MILQLGLTMNTKWELQWNIQDKNETAGSDLNWALYVCQSPSVLSIQTLELIELPFKNTTVCLDDYVHKPHFVVEGNDLIDL
jgi:hypothetical protein